MSLGTINSLEDLFKKIKQLKAEGKSAADIAKLLKELVIADFPRYFGRYESASGRVWFEIYQQSESVENGAVRFRMGEEYPFKLEEDLILPPEQAITKFRQLAVKGFWPVFSAKTQEEMDEANEARIRGNEDILGLFVKDREFIRVDCYGDNYSLQRGYVDTVTSADHEQTEEQAREFVRVALENGFHRKGERPVSQGSDNQASITIDLNLD